MQECCSGAIYKCVAIVTNTIHIRSFQIETTKELHFVNLNESGYGAKNLGAQEAIVTINLS